MNKYLREDKEAGFSLVEMVVAVGILMILSAGFLSMGYAPKLQHERQVAVKNTVDAAYNRAMQSAQSFDNRFDEQTAIRAFESTTSKQKIELSAGRAKTDEAPGWCLWVKGVDSKGFEYERKSVKDDCTGDDYVPASEPNLPVIETADPADSPKQMVAKFNIKLVGEQAKGKNVLNGAALWGKVPARFGIVPTEVNDEFEVKSWVTGVESLPDSLDAGTLLLKLNGQTYILNASEGRLVSRNGSLGTYEFGTFEINGYSNIVRPVAE